MKWNFQVAWLDCRGWPDLIHNDDYAHDHTTPATVTRRNIRRQREKLHFIIFKQRKLKLVINCWLIKLIMYCWRKYWHFCGAVHFNANTNNWKLETFDVCCFELSRSPHIYGNCLLFICKRQGNLCSFVILIRSEAHLWICFKSGIEDSLCWLLSDNAMCRCIIRNGLTLFSSVSNFSNSEFWFNGWMVLNANQTP